MNWYLRVVQNYVNFSGRARRKELWFFVLFNIIFSVVAMVIDNILGLAMKEVGYGPVYILYALAMLLPGLAVAVRRLHDIGKSGWHYLWALLPCIGSIVLLVFFVTEGEPHDNAYGPDPKAAERSALSFS